ncbi:head completion/stabilization protein [uncultured Pseudacidovorax sp.]|uniref:head completion/stabilization protein n=1 Tax=uncultured Pseudacidovorax sp. TaxID=679313 RepID=UPI0025D2CB3B|nr:head completion/stabilization protein [uncultured Pseudacidovorax sp.]
MSFIAAAPPLVRTTPPSDPAPLGTVSAGAWWPEIDLAALRDAMRLDGTITAERLRPAVQDALASTIEQLLAWSLVHITAGRPSFADVPALVIDGESVNVQRFRRAVYCTAKANLIERYSDYDTTGRARKDTQEETRDGQAEEHRRDATWAIRDILGVPRLTVDLI